MKTKLPVALLLFLILLAAGRTGLAQEKSGYSQTAANDAVEAACQQAAKESKVVFIKSGIPECDWCRFFDCYHRLPEVQKIVGKYCVVVAIDAENMPDGNKVFSRYAVPATPAWVIITPQKKVIIDSYAPEGNVGYPLEPNETTYYLAALKKATPAITDDELKTLSVQIQKAAAKK
jgi:hypothetical protein